MRNYDRAQHRRQVAFSADGGQTFSGQRHDEALPEPICQAAIERYRWPDEREPGVVLFSNPAHASERLAMTLRASFDDAASWPRALVLHAGPSGYSDLATLPDGRIACLYECGEQNSVERIVLALVESSELGLGHARPSPRGPASLR